jgi:hypothetical protein
MYDDVRFLTLFSRDQAVTAADEALVLSCDERTANFTELLQQILQEHERKSKFCHFITVPYRCR